MEGFRKGSRRNTLSKGRDAFIGLLSFFMAGGTMAQPWQKPMTQAEIDASVSPEERAARRAYEARAKTDPKIIAMQAAGAQREAAMQKKCAALRARVARGDRSGLGTELSSFCGID
ncbi:MAG: hypothetical protein V4437_01165 [Patescibacteria group bacterium]